MAKKGESDEKVQADGGPEEGKGTVSGGTTEREAAALVGGGDRGAVEGEGAELAPPAPGAAGDGAGVVSDDGQDPAPVVPAGDPGAGETDAQGADQAAAGLAPDGEGHVESGRDLAAGAPAAVTDLDDYVAKLRDDPAYAVAMGGFQAAYVAALAIAAGGKEDVGDVGDVVRRTTAEALLDIAVFVRKIGRRATADVIGQQLKILGHRASPDLSEPERIAFAVFAHVLVELDAFAAAEAERARKAAETPAEVPPLPVEETTLEPVDDHFDTWR